MRASLGIALLGLTACNPSGTCLLEDDQSGTLGAQCIVNTPKRTCVGKLGPGEFFAEDPGAGLARCTARGYSEPPGSRPLPADAVRVLHKNGPATR
jgi:hypothetical protein